MPERWIAQGKERLLIRRDSCQKERGVKLRARDADGRVNVSPGKTAGKGGFYRQTTKEMIGCYWFAGGVKECEAVRDMCNLGWMNLAGSASRMICLAPIPRDNERFNFQQ